MTETGLDEAIVARCGSGKTATAIEPFARRHDESTVEWIDPNGENDGRDNHEGGENV